MSFDLSLSEDQAALAELFGTFFTREAPPAVARAAEPLGYDAALWRRLVETGAPSLAAPADAGGGGVPLSGLVVVAEALGRAIAPVPLVEHLAATLVHPARDAVAGDAIATLSPRPATRDGLWPLVPAGAVADVVIGVDGEELVAVRSEPPGRAPRNHASAPIADRSTAGDRVVLGDAATLAPALDAWRVLSAASLVGVAAAALDMGVAYAMERRQFGVPIGSFQSVQHGLASLAGMVDGARLLVHKAAWAAGPDGASATTAGGASDPDDNDVTDPTALAAMAWIFASDVAAQATDRSLHYHGGYGFAAEYDIQLYYRRARGWALVLDDPGRECLRLADRLFGPAA